MVVVGGVCGQSNRGKESQEAGEVEDGQEELGLSRHFELRCMSWLGFRKRRYSVLVLSTESVEEAGINMVLVVY